MIIPAGEASLSGPEGVLHDTKLCSLMYSCYHARNATEESQQKAVHLMSACAVAHPDAYSVLLPLLERILWMNDKPSNQSIAAAGTTYKA